MLGDIFSRIIEKICMILRNKKYNGLLEDLQFSYELRKKIFCSKLNENREMVEICAEKPLYINLDISQREYNFFKMIDLNIFELIRYFEKLNNEKVAIIGNWIRVEYKPIFMHEPDGRIVYRYSIYFGNIESIQQSFC